VVGIVFKVAQENGVSDSIRLHFDGAVIKAFSNHFEFCATRKSRQKTSVLKSESVCRQNVRFTTRRWEESRRPEAGCENGRDDMFHLIDLLGTAFDLRCPATPA